MLWALTVRQIRLGGRSSHVCERRRTVCVRARVEVVGVRKAGRSEAEVGPGQAYVIEPGHDAWVIGDERFVALEFESRSEGDGRRRV
jgi:hypothetical protein